MNNLTKQPPDEKLVLTQFLYAKDEVFLSMLVAILTKQLDETMFWFSEWITSVENDEACEQIWKIYYDFYCIRYPKIERYIHRKIISIKKHSDRSEQIKQFANIIKNLLVSNPCSDVFILRQYMKNNPYPTVIYKGRRPKWCKNFDKGYVNLLLSISKRNWYNICFFLDTLHSKALLKPFVDETDQRNVLDDLHNVIITYFQTVEDISINMDFVFKKWADITYNNKKHLLLAIIVYLIKPEEEIDIQKKMFVSITKKEEKQILEFQQNNNDCDHQDTPLKPYEKFKIARKYAINKYVGCFDLARFNLSQEYKQIYRNHWEYFAMKSPYWRESMNKFNITPDAENYKIHFQDDPEDDKYEAFYEKYGYEPDEQSIETQDKSLLDIPEMEYNIWLENYFPDTEPIINFSKKKSDKSDDENNIYKFVW